MRTALRAVLVGSLACLAVPLVPQVALAETATEPAGIGAYFWRGKLPSTITVGPVSQPNPANGGDTDADTVARDELAVGVVTPGQTDKETFLIWDLLELTEDDTITKFVVTMPLSESGVSDDLAKNTVQNGVGADLQACAPKGGVGNTDAGAYENKPEVDTTRCAPGTFDAAKNVYVFDVTSLASTWLTGDNYGIAILPVSLDTPLQIVFKPTAAHIAQIAYTAGAPEAPLDLDLGLDTGAGTSTTTFDEGFTSGGGGESVLSSAPLSVFTEPLTAGGSEPVAQPEAAAAPVTQVAAAQPVALRSVPGRPPLSFWLAVAALAALLLGMSLTTGARVATGALAAPRQGRVLQQIQALASTRAPGRGLA